MENQSWKDKELDKDLLVCGNKVYSPEFCVFVPSEINQLLHENFSSPNGLPIGVNFDKHSGKYKAQIGIRGKRSHIGLYISPEAARVAYLKVKVAHVSETAFQQVSPLKEALIEWCRIKNEEIRCQ
jgi:hypothetical protein